MKNEEWLRIKKPRSKTAGNGGFFIPNSSFLIPNHSRDSGGRDW